VEIMRCVFGSHLYGLEGPNSDRDYKGIYLPTRDELLLGRYAKVKSHSTGGDRSKNTKDDVDIEIFSLPQFIKLACEGQTVAIDMLHAPDHLTLTSHPIWCELRGLRRDFYSRNMKSYIGYARKQANKYGVKGSRIAAVESLLGALRSFSPEESALKIGAPTLWERLPQNEFLRMVSEKDRWNKEGQPINFYEVCGRRFSEFMPVGNLVLHAERILSEYGERAAQARLNSGVDWKAVSHALRAS
jgi:hypothetical protein